MKIFFLLFLSLFSARVVADSLPKVLSGYDPQADNISGKYEAGAMLIYDCEDQHWVCVLPSYFEDCILKRKEDQMANKIQSRCVAFSSFPTKKSCFQKQLFLTGHNYSSRFCYNGKWRAREVTF